MLSFIATQRFHYISAKLFKTRFCFHKHKKNSVRASPPMIQHLNIPWFKCFSLVLDGFVFSGPEFNSYLPFKYIANLPASFQLGFLNFCKCQHLILLFCITCLSTFCHPFTRVYFTSLFFFCTFLIFAIFFIMYCASCFYVSVTNTKACATFVTEHILFWLFTVFI